MDIGFYKRFLHSPLQAPALFDDPYFESVGHAYRIAYSDSDAVSVAAATAGSDAFRFRHAFEVSRAIDVLNARGIVKDVAPLSQSAAALEKCGSVWRVRRRDAGLKVDGKADCVGLVRALSAREMEDLLLAISRFDRRQLVEIALSAMHSAAVSHRRWESTASAMRAIHGAERDQSISLRETSRANAVLRTSAIIAEVANTAAAEAGGDAVGDLDLEELQSKVLALLFFADMLPSLLGDWQTPKLRISPTGDLRSDHSFSDLTLKSTAERRHRQDRSRAIASYRERFEIADLLPDDNDNALGEALKAEYGVPHAALREFSNAVAELACEDGRDVAVMKRSRLIDRLKAKPGLETFDFAPLIDRLTTRPRPLWSDIPPGAAPGDFDLSKFDRRFSLIGRPVLALDSGDDPQLALAAGAIERALFHNMSGALGGDLQNAFWQSPTMREYASRQGAATGLAFNDRVAETLADLQLETWASAKPSWALNRRKTAEIETLGDVDVLVLCRRTNVVWVVEAKDLKLCRTLGEVARRLAEYRGHSDAKGRPDALLRHLRRVAYLQDHASELVGRLRLAAAPRVCGVVLVKSPQPMSQVTIHPEADAKVVMLEDAETVPWADGWS